MIDKWSITIPELSGDEPRNLYVYLPDFAEENPEQRFPVLYMFDGHNVFFDEDATYGKSWGMQEFAEDSALPLIIAAVECTHDPNNGRLSEYSPFTFSEEGLGRIKGRGRQTMEWMIHSFKPMIDKKYPTLPDREHSFIAGSSMGGLMSLYAAIRYNRWFSKAACLSSAITPCFADMGREILSHRLDADTRVYLSWGTEEAGGTRPEYGDNLTTRTARCNLAAEALLREQNVIVRTHCQLFGQHCEADWEKQIPLFMDFLWLED